MSNQLIVKMVLDAWHASIKNASKLIETLTDEQIAKDVCTNGNSGTYLMGHLIAVHDGMPSLIGQGDKKYPEMVEVYLQSADKSKPQTISAA